MTMSKDPVKAAAQRLAVAESNRRRWADPKYYEEHKGIITEIRKRPEVHSLILSKQTGRCRTEKTKQRISESNVGKHEYLKTLPRSSNQIENSRHMGLSNIGRICSMSERIAMSESRRGENNNQFVHGLTSLYKSIRYCFRMKEWIRQVLERDGFKCFLTGEEASGHLNAHHIISFKSLLELYNIKTFDEAMKCEALWDISNGITLKDTVHFRLHGKYGHQIPTGIFFS